MLLNANRFFMNVAYLLRSAGVKRQDRLAEWRRKCFRIILQSGVNVSKKGEEVEETYFMCCL